MTIDFFYHICIISIIFFIICSGFKFFLKIKTTLDFSYIWIVIFATYVWFYLNINYDFWLISSSFFAFLLSTPITILLVYLSSKLKDMYFVIGTFSIYLVILQIAYNAESLTWWIFWLSLENQTLIWSYTIDSIWSFFIIYGIIALIILFLLFILRISYFFRVLQWWWENELSLKAMWFKTNIYKFIMILITSLLASFWWNLYWFYYNYIEPNSFWLVLLNLILIISLLSYKFNGVLTLLTAFLTIWAYEYLRIFKFVDVAQVWYFREIIFWIIIMLTSYLVFRFTDFGREV